MSNTLRQNPIPFRPEVGGVYENVVGGSYRCIRTIEPWCDAELQNTASGWTCIAHGIVRYEDGTIEWDYSTQGHFTRLEESEIRNRQESMLNALLCCFI